ncbi:MAG: hypothetical protein R3E87_20265 [Burkholderiaceae bacterium]
MTEKLTAEVFSPCHLDDYRVVVVLGQCIEALVSIMIASRLAAFSAPQAARIAIVGTRFAFMPPPGISASWPACDAP